MIGAVGPGVERARARLEARRKAQAERLANATGDRPTRQAERAALRRLGKMPIGASQADWHRARNLPTIKPRRRKS